MEHPASKPPSISLAGVSVRFGPIEALADVSLELAPGAVTALVGRSGCGKSTLLRVIAGIEQVASGVVDIGGVTVTGPGRFVEPQQRGVGFVFQDYALFPHLTVLQNIVFGLRRFGGGERRRRGAEMLERLGVGALAARYPHMLSGGEQQRIALARALAPGPSVLLMDEPFSNLDPHLRDAVRDETMQVVRELGTTAVVVTHDAEEALLVGDRVVLMQAGRVIASGPGDSLYDNPQSLYAAEFFSRFNRVPTARSGFGLDSPLGRFRLESALDGPGAIALLIRPQAVRMDPAGRCARVLERRLLGEIEELHLALPGLAAPLVMRTTQRTGLQPYEEVKVSVSSEDLLLLDEDSGRVRHLRAAAPAQDVSPALHAIQT